MLLKRRAKFEEIDEGRMGNENLKMNLKSSSSVVLTRLTGPRSRPTTFFL
jgi:hypothetical protein